LNRVTVQVPAVQLRVDGRDQTFNLRREWNVLDDRRRERCACLAKRS
jgi:hypothetical protein